MIQTTRLGSAGALRELARHLPDALSDRPAVHRLERQHSKDQQVKGALNKIGWLAHASPISY